MSAPEAERHAKAVAKVNLEIERLERLIDQLERRIAEATAKLLPLEAELVEWKASKDTLEADAEVKP
jgi:phage shock protein A